MSLAGVVLTFDERASALVQEAWRRLDEAGFPSLLRHTHRRHVPHLTLALADGLPVEAARAAALACGDPGSLWLAGTARFPGEEGVLYLTVAPTIALLDVHEQVDRALAGCALRDYYRPGRWSPHVTLGLGVPPGASTAVLDEVGLPLLARATGIAHADDQTGVVTPLRNLP